MGSGVEVVKAWKCCECDCHGSGMLRGGTDLAAAAVWCPLTSRVMQSYLAYLQPYLCVGELYPGLYYVWMILQRVRGSSGLSSECGHN